MKKILFIEGVDGAGKTTLIKKLQQHYLNQGLDCKIFDKTTPPFYKELVGINTRYNLNITPIGILCSKMTRYHLVLELAKKKGPVIWIIDRGPFYLLASSNLEKIPNDISTGLVRDFVNSIENTSHSIYLKANATTAINRIKTRGGEEKELYGLGDLIYELNKIYESNLIETPNKNIIETDNLSAEMVFSSVVNLLRDKVLHNLRAAY